MKFVHLSEQPLIARIKKSGIRCGDGRHGRGVYAVPLMVIDRIAYREDDPHLPADPVSSSRLWSWLAGLGDRHRHFAAIIFHDTPAHWPAELYIELDAKTGCEWLPSLDSRLVTIAETHLQDVREAHEFKYMATLQVTVHSAAGLGAVLHGLRIHGYAVWDANDESIEVVFARPIPARSIVRVIPQYRSNKQFKQLKGTLN